MPKLFPLFFLLLLLAPAQAAPPLEKVQPPSQAEQWLDSLLSQALQGGISRKTFQEALGDWRILPEVLRRDQKQAEFTLSFGKYLGNLVTEHRIETGRLMGKKHAELLKRLDQRFGVPPQVILALWGVESNFGTRKGDFPLFDSLATLAWKGRRQAFFQRQIFSALRLLERGWISPQNLESSWAGAMGNFQFIPSTYLAYALDFDGDQKPDLQNSITDSLASAANYLQSEGWKDSFRWGREVFVPKNFDWAQVNTTQPLTHWQRLGLKQADGQNVASEDIPAQLLAPQGAKGPLFLVYDNYRVLLRWNRSMFFALAVGHLADRIAGLPPLSQMPLADSDQLSALEMRTLQQKLAEAGYNPGKIDGKSGPKTRNAAKQAQQDLKLIPDGFPNRELLLKITERLKNATPPSN